MRSITCRRGAGAIRLELLLFGAVLALLALSLYLAWGVGELEGVGGYAHEEFAGMRVGGSGVERHGSTHWLGWAFGVLTLVVFSLLLAFGARRGGSLRGIAKPLLAGFLLNAAVLTWLMVSYAGYAEDPSGTWFLGFPLSSAITLYLFYPVTVIFSAYFVIGFRRWVLTEEDERRYEEIAERLERRREGSA